MADQTTRLPGGITNARKRSAMATLGIPDPAKWHVFFDDFDRYLASDWVVTAVEAGTGASSRALADGRGGRLLITNDNADNDAVFLQTVGEGFLLSPGKRTFFAAKFQVSDATQSDVVFGLQIRDTTPLAVSDGVFFLKADGAATADVVHMRGSTTTTKAAATTIVSATDVVWAFVYDGLKTVSYYANDVLIAQLQPAIICDTELTVSFGVQNGDAVIRTLNTDYIFAAEQR